MKKREIHGLRHSPEYKVWSDMRQRCNNPNRRDYPRYGGKGVKVCERWDSSFKAFYEDMGARPSRKYSIDRINSSGNYEASNCRWATALEQSRNRGGFNVVYKGELAEDAAVRLGIAQSTMSLRVKRWGVGRAFTTPSFGLGGSRKIA